VILISIDTLRADHLPSYGYHGVETPHLDRFRKDAILYEHAYSHCPMTLPSHLSMLTGLLPTEHHVRNNVGFVFKGERESLPTLLKRQGYETGAAVSSYVLRAETGLARLFDYYEDSLDPRPGAPFSEYQRPGGITAGFAKEWIDARKAGPFFFFFHIYEPHVPYEPPEPFKSRYSNPYDGEIATADAIVGDLLNHLRETGVYDRAVIVLTSDHGEGLGDHGEDQHSILLYVEAIRVPLLLKLPRSVSGGDRIDATAQLIDILPTITSLLGIESPRGLRGRPLLGLTPTEDRLVYSETLYPRIQLGWSELRAVVGERYHFIDSPRPELYDVRQDPGERHDIVAADPKTASALKKSLDAFGRAMDKVTPDPDAAEGLATIGYIGTPRERGHEALPNPKDNLEYLGMMRDAFRLAQEGRLERSATALSEILKRNPAMVEVWAKLGEVCYEMGRYGDSAAAFTMAVTRSPVVSGDLLVSLGQAQLRNGRPDEATSSAKLALPFIPSKAHELLARIELAQKRSAEAEKQARLAVDPKNPQPSSMLFLAEVQEQRGDFARALEVLSDAEKRAGELKMTKVHRLEFLRADILARSNHLAEAEAAYRREIRDFPGELPAYANLAVLLFVQGKRQESSDLLSQMATANPNARGYSAAARTLETLGDAQGASRWKRLAREASLSAK